MRNSSVEHSNSTYSPPHPSRRDRRADSQSSTTSSSSSHLESSVTRLLVATKHLLEGLTQWSVGRQTEMQVSDIYVRLGNDFNMACMGFERAGIDMSELHSVPDDLRFCLETALSEEASPATLEVHLPKIREIIIRLLQGLKTKQSRYRAMRSQERRIHASSPVPGATASDSPDQQRQPPPPSTSTPAPPLDDTTSSRPDRYDSKSTVRQPSNTPPSASQTSLLREESNRSQSQASNRPKRGSVDSDSDAVSAAASVASSRRTAQHSSSSRPRPSQLSSKSLSSVNISSTAPQSTAAAPSESPTSPPLPPVPYEISLRKSSRANASKGSLGLPNMDNIPPPPPAPANDSLEALKKSEGLQRRASKRFSSYTFSKMTSSGPASQGLSFLDDSPTEKDQSARELVSASRQRYRGAPPSKEARLGETSTPVKKKNNTGSSLPSPVVVTAPDLTTLSPTIEEDEVTSTPGHESTAFRHESETSTRNVATPDAPSIISSQTPTSFPIFLQLGRQVKKVHVDNQPSIPSIRMLFTERFQYSPGYADFPGVYLRDPVTGIQYELEDIGEIKENSILCLNVEPFDEVKSQIDQGLANLTKELKEVKAALTLGRRQSTLGGDLLATGVTPSFVTTNNYDSPRQKSSGSSPTTPKREINKELRPGSNNAAMKLQADIENFRREIGGLRQVQADFTSETRSVIEAARVQAGRVREIAQTKVGGARALVETGKKKLDDNSQNLLTRIEALQDVIDDLKTDVVSRRMQPKESTLQTLQNDIKSTRVELDSIGRFIESVRPEWQRTWKAELQNIVDEQDLLKHQEQLHSDLIADHDNIIQVFELIRKYIDLRSTHKSPKEYVVPEKTEDHQGLATVMLQVKGQTADSDKRLKAIEATEKARIRELNSRKNDEFHKELTGFVDNKMLKRIGGAEEAEKIRALRDERNFKTMFNSQPISPQTSSPGGPSSPQSNSSAPQQ